MLAIKDNAKKEQYCVTKYAQLSSFKLSEETILRTHTPYTHIRIYVYLWVIVCTLVAGHSLVHEYISLSIEVTIPVFITIYSAQLTW